MLVIVGAVDLHDLIAHFESRELRRVLLVALPGGEGLHPDVSRPRARR